MRERGAPGSKTERDLDVFLIMDGTLDPSWESDASCHMLL